MLSAYLLSWRSLLAQDLRGLKLFTVRTRAYIYSKAEASFPAKSICLELMKHTVAYMHTLKTKMKRPVVPSVAAYTEMGVLEGERV